MVAGPDPFEKTPGKARKRRRTTAPLHNSHLEKWGLEPNAGIAIFTANIGLLPFRRELAGEFRYAETRVTLQCHV